MRRSLLVSLAAVIVVLSMALGLMMGRSVLAENGSVDVLTVRTTGAQEFAKIVGSSSGIESQTSTDWVNLTSASITIPAGHTDLVIAEFVATSSCFDTVPPAGGGSDDYCRVRLRAGPTDMYPRPDTNFVFDDADASGFLLGESRAVTRFICLSGGASGTTMRVYVDWWPSDDSTFFSIDSWTLKLTRSHGCATS
jgi:hypothetical protein